MEIKTSTIPKAWIKIIETVLSKGEHIEDKIEMQETISTIITDPGRDMLHKRFTFNKSQMELYSAQVLSGENPTGHPYTYGGRFRIYGSSAVDQLSSMIQRLNQDPDSRRATAVLWVPEIDTVSSEVPCWTAANATIRKGYLNFRALFRSHDMFGGLPANCFMLFKMQEYIANATQSKPGLLQVVSWNPHIYLADYPTASEVIGGIA